VQRSAVQRRRCSAVQRDRGSAGAWEPVRDSVAWGSAGSAAWGSAAPHHGGGRGRGEPQHSMVKKKTLPKIKILRSEN